MGGLRPGEDVTSPFLPPVCAVGTTANNWIFDENWRPKPVAQGSQLIYCVQKTVYSILGRTVTNLGTRGLVIFDMNHPEYFSVLIMENFVQNCNIVSWR